MILCFLTTSQRNDTPAIAPKLCVSPILFLQKPPLEGFQLSTPVFDVRHRRCIHLHVEQGFSRGGDERLQRCVVEQHAHRIGAAPGNEVVELQHRIRRPELRDPTARSICRVE